MFENAFSDDNNSPFKLLQQLLSKEDIEMKTDLNMAQIRQLCQIKWFSLLETKPDTEPYELLAEVMEYFMMLSTSLDRQARTEIIKGISEMKDKMIDTSILKPTEVK